METQNNVKYLVVGIALVLVGAIVSTIADPYLPVSFSNAKKGYQSGFDAAKKLVEGSNLGAIMNPTGDINALSGIVTSIKGNSITFRALSNNPFEDPAVNDRTVLISPSTEIILLVQKDPKVFQSELSVFMKDNKPSAPLTPPQPFSQASGTLANLKEGDSVIVSSSENIRSMKEFTAATVTIVPKVKAAPAGVR